MAVMIDIPGIGQVEAQNAASEATLKAILAAMGGGGGRGGGWRQVPFRDVCCELGTLTAMLARARYCESRICVHVASLRAHMSS